MKHELSKLVWSWVKPYFWIAILGVFLTIPVGLFDAAIAAFLRPYINVVLVGKDANYSTVIPLAIIAFTLIQGIFTYSSAYVNAWVGNKITFGVKRKLYHKLLQLDVSYFDHNQSGTIFMRFSTDAETACTGLINNVRFFLTRFFSTISLAGVLFFNSWQLAIIAIVVIGIAIYPVKIVRKKMRTLQTKDTFSVAAATTVYNETFSGNRTISAYNLQEYQENRFSDIMNSRFKLSMRIARHTNWLSPVMHLIISFGIALVLWLGGWLVVNNHMSSGAFTSFVAALLMMYTPIKSIGNNVAGIQNSLLAMERIQNILNLKPKIPNSFSSCEKPIDVHEGIHFDHVEFQYIEGQKVLKGINFKVPAGETVGIVGNSGGGKTSLVHLLDRLYDVTSGAIRIDGKDIRQIPIEQLRRSISIVFQDNFLFSGTIRENILLGNPKATEKEIQNALDDAYLTPFIATLPNGIDTEVGERGILLSGGQKQRIAIARAMLRNAPIVILDEATSALDNRSEAVVQQALDNLSKGKTVLIIAHRLSTLKHASEIFVLDQGNIAEHGTQEELLQIPDGIFARLWTAQFGEKK